MVAVLSGVLSPALAWLHVLPLHWPHPGWAGIAGGAVLTLAGLVLAATAQHALGTSWRIGVDTDERTGLVTDGLCAVIRNPIFTALLIIQCGAALMAPTWLAVVGLGAFVLACQLQVRLVEEPYLLTTHSNSYAATRPGPADSYRSSVGRAKPTKAGGSPHPAPEVEGTYP